MGGWAVYCAICGGPFSSQVEMDPEGTDERCYRYDVLKNCDLEWLDELCALGMNPDATGDDKALEIAVHDIFKVINHVLGGIEVARGDDPNVPFDQTADNIPMIAYYDYGGGTEGDTAQPLVFPFHEICYHDILQRCLKQEYSGQIRGDVLFNVFESLNGGRYVRLQLDYGEPEPPAEQFWYHQPGHELLVVNPVQIAQIDADIERIKRSLCQKASPNQNPGKWDIFDKLPHELRHEIFKLLPAGSILALKAASWTMHVTTLPRGFWRDTLRAEIPWLWEIHDVDVFQSQESEDKASKLLLDIEKKSRYTAENDDYVLGLANRRRIWGVCEQIRTRYLDGLA